jgi:hypothetical protein
MQKNNTDKLIEKPVEELLAIRSHLMRQLKGLDPAMVNGSLAHTRVQCGRPGCRCQDGEKHPKTNLVRSTNGRSQAMYVPLDIIDDVSRGVEEFKRAKELLKEIADVNWAILRGHGRRQRQKREAAKGLRLVD